METESQPRERIHFVQISVQNHMRVRRANVFLPERGVVPVSGANKAGKTSFKRSLVALIGGDSVVEEAPRTKDAPEDEEAYIIGTLSDGTTLRRAFTGAASAPKGRLTAKDADDKHLSQTHLNELVGPRAIEPMVFFEKREKDQAEILMGYSPGLRETLEELNAEKERLEDERRPHNSQIQVLGRIPEPEGERPEPIDVSGEMDLLRRLQTAQEERKDATQRLREIKETYESVMGRIEEIDAQLDQLMREKGHLEAQVEELTAEGQQTKKELDTLPDVEADIEAAQTRISEADAVNAALKPWERYDEAQEALEEHRAERDRYNEALENVETKKRKALAAADLPFTDLSIGDDGDVLLGGVPLSAASGMERCRLALEVAIADDPDLGVVFMNGNELDNDALGEIHRMAETHDFQVIMDLIHSPGYEGEVLMDDGVATQAGSTT